MPCGSNLIFNYKTKDYEKFFENLDNSCEVVCIRISKKLNISPPTRLLFGLRISGTKNWLPPSHNLQPDVKYDFRIRFKVPQLTTLKKLDIVTYDYLYHQVRYDLVNEEITEIKYPAFKDNVLGLGVIDMYIDMLEKNYSIDDLQKSYKKYIPKELNKRHFIFAKRRIAEGLRAIKKKDHDIFYVKGTYLESIKSMAPNYLIEEFEGKADYLAEDGFGCGKCPVTIEFNPFHEEQPGLRVYYTYKKEWKHILRLENIYTLYREGEDVVRFELSDRPDGFRLSFNKIPELESFITYVAGYHRLSVKWIVDLCVEYLTPSLQELKDMKYHGPIGGEYSYAKINEKNKNEGSYIVRQCEKNYDTYFVDMNTKGSQTETFKITRDSQQWILHIQECERRFNKLTELVRSINTKSSQKFRIPPSEYDKPPLLLICLPRNQVTAKKTVSKLSEADIHRNRVQIIDPKIDLQWYKNSQKDCDGGRMVQIRADWILPGDTNLNVTLKVLKTERDFTEFMHLANRWSKMYSPEFIKLYGLTLSTPHTLVMEHAAFGPLNKFLRRDPKVSLLCLLEAVHALVRAMVYMQENDLIHAYIRCANLHVVQYNDATNTLVVKLADPGFHKPYRAEDLPWIPVTYYEQPERAKIDLFADLWSFATTVWEIFSRGKVLQCSKELLLKNYNTSNHQILPIPCEKCPLQILEIIRDGWNPDVEKRFSQQSIFARLSATKQAYSHSLDYSTPAPCVGSSYTSSLKSDSEFSAFTDDTMLNGHSDSEPSGTFSDFSINGDTTPFITRTRTSRTNAQQSNNFLLDTASVVKLKTGKVVYKNAIGEGNYGVVYLGEFHYYKKNMQPKQVAIKTLKELQNRQDFRREIAIMQALNHPNIVKILDYFDDPNSPLSIIMEYVECGPFNTYLACNKPRLTNDRLLRYAYDIAKGMEYLGRMNVIHRDLAARNILVNSDCLKISDFGLAQIADSNGYYFVQNATREIPIQWYSLEALQTHKFSFQSDVWSYGVTLYEVFSRGENPILNPNTTISQAEELISMLEKGDRLPRPELCPENIYNELMTPCWHHNPKSRPDFRGIMDIIEVIFSESGECIM